MEQVGRYRLLEQIGRTDVASIHRAYEVTGGGLVRPVTLKRMLPDHARRFERDAVLVEEARIQERLDHPNVVTVLDLDQVDGVWFSVEERIEGRDLGTLLAKARQRGQKIDHDAGLFITIQFLQGLAQAHGRGIVHRDLSPQNVWVAFDGTVRLGGFGYAQLEGRPEPLQPGLDKPRYGYVSPEQATGGTVDHRSDLFSAGLILWELIAGSPAYDAVDAADLLAKARRGAIRGIRRAAPDAGAEIHEAIEKATALNPEQRPVSAQALRDELARILFKREPTYGPPQLAAVVTRILADEAAEDRKKDEEARTALRTRSLLIQPKAPAPAPEPPEPPAVESPPLLPDPPPPPAPEALPHASAPPAELMDTKPSFGKLAVGLAVLGLVGLTVFALSSESNMRLVKRKAREALVGRKPGGNLTIDSVPGGALVFLDDEHTGKITPITIENVESEVIHVVRLELEGERPVTATVSVEANANRKISLLFPNAVVELRVKTDPPGAELFRDGRALAFSPATLPMRAGEPFTLVIKKAGYLTAERELTLERGKAFDLEVTLEKTKELMAAEAEIEKAQRKRKRQRR